MVLINGKASRSFDIQKGGATGCSLSLYLFMLVGEAFNMVVKEDQCQGKIQGIKLLENDDQQFLSQYANDNSFSFFGQEIFSRNAVDPVHHFGSASGVIIN